METEGPFIKVPIECVSQVFRKTRKTVTQELTAVLREINNLAADGPDAAVDASVRLGELTDRLARLKATYLHRQSRTVGLLVDPDGGDNEAAAPFMKTLKPFTQRLFLLAQEAATEEKRHLSGLRKRLDLLAQPATAPLPPPLMSMGSAHTTEGGVVQSPGEKTRLDRCIVEYFLRRGHSEAARELSEEAGIQDYVTIELFERAKDVEAAIRAKDLGPALRWCDDNASRLRKLESTLEFRVRERDFLEMVRANKRVEAIEYAKNNLTAYATSHSAEFRRAMATLAFSDPAASPVPEYAALFADERWGELASEFLKEMQGVFGLTQPSMLEIVLQSGLSVIKTPLCLEDKNRLAHCPTCSAEGRALGEGLPCAHHGHSFLICRQSGDPIGHDNPPLALPNGRVYGSRAIQAMTRPPTRGVGVVGVGGTHGGLLGGDSVVTCPSTGKKFRYDQLRNVYII